MSFGIDKLLLTTKEFKVHTNNGLRIKQGDILPDGEIIESKLYNEVHGTKAIYNSPLVNLTIDHRGLKAEYNPSKILHPYELTNDNKALEEVHKAVEKDLKNNGIHLPTYQELRLSRLDLARNTQMNMPVNMYAPLFGSLKGKRQSNAEYPSSYYFKNKSQELNFYDKNKALEFEYKKKGEKSTPYIPTNTMRGEDRFKNSRTVGNIMRFNSFDGLLKSNPRYREDKFKTHLISQVFNGQKDVLQTSMFVDYQREVELLKTLKEQSQRGSLQTYKSMVGIESLLEKFGTLENYRLFLLECGFSNKYTFREVAKVQKQLHQVSMYYGGKENKQNLTNLYNEVYEKFCA